MQVRLLPDAMQDENRCVLALHRCPFSTILTLLAMGFKTQGAVETPNLSNKETI